MTKTADNANGNRMRRQSDRLVLCGGQYNQENGHTEAKCMEARALRLFVTGLEAVAHAHVGMALVRRRK